MRTRWVIAGGLLLLAGSAAPILGYGQDEVETKGRALFFEHCYGCHTLGAAGTPIAPDLAHIGSRYTQPELALRLRDPKLHREAARMPKLDLSTEDARALSTYLATLR